VSSLSDSDRGRLIERYVTRFAKHGMDPLTLNIGNQQKYQRQHAVHMLIGPLDGATVLDVGCGLANFYETLSQRGRNVSYIGYDVVEPFIEANRERFPKATFRTIDISRDDIVDRFDYAVMCQVFNNKYKDACNDAVLKAAINKTFAAATRGVSVDMLSSYVSFTEDNLYYFSPEQVFAFAKTLTPYVTLLHGYAEHHFTIQLLKGPLPP
jgi:SAM-dependent methyltransferase